MEHLQRSNQTSHSEQSNRDGVGKPQQQSPAQGSRSSWMLGNGKREQLPLLWSPAKTIPFLLETNPTQNASLLAVTLRSENKAMGKLTESHTSVITDGVFLLQELMAADFPSHNKVLSVTSDPRRAVRIISLFPTITWKHIISFHPPYQRTLTALSLTYPPYLLLLQFSSHMHT